MSVYLQEPIWVVVNEAERPNAPVPRPLSSGFSSNKAYRVLGLHCPTETSEAYFVLCNDRNEVWFVSNQHFRVYEGEQHSKPLEFATSQAPVLNGHRSKRGVA
jgi:hypothetical protein